MWAFGVGLGWVDSLDYFLSVGKGRFLGVGWQALIQRYFPLMGAGSRCRRGKLGGQVGASWAGRLGLVETGWDQLGQVETGWCKWSQLVLVGKGGWDILRQVGQDLTGWGKLGPVWGRLNLGRLGKVVGVVVGPGLLRWGFCGGEADVGALGRVRG